MHTTTQNGQSATAAVCTDCRTKLSLPTEIQNSRERITELTTSMFQDCVCVNCGTVATSSADYEADTSILGADAEALVRLLTLSKLDVFATIIANDTERTIHARADDGSIIAQSVRPAGDRLLHVMIDSWKSREERYQPSTLKARAEKIETIVENAQLELVSGAAPANLSEYKKDPDTYQEEWEVLAKV